MVKLTMAAPAALLAACALAGCGKEPAGQAAVPPAAPAVAAAVSAPATPAPQAGSGSAVHARMMELLRAVYGAATAREQYVLAEMPMPDQRDAVAVFRLEPVAMRELADGRVALVANAQMADDNEEGISSHATAGLLSAYLLRQVNGQWRVEARHENIAELGSFGQFGEVEWVMLGEGRPGFTVQHGGTWQGYTISHLSVFDLNERTMRDLSGGLPVYSSDEGACGGDKSTCWTTNGKWQFEKRAGARYDDLVLRFQGYEETRPEGAPEDAARERKEQTGMARYKFDGRAYVLVEGENIVRGI